MKNSIIILSFLAIGSIPMKAQVGVNTPNPGSTLDVSGSLAAQYRAITATAYMMNATDFHISYNGTANSTFTLPTAISGVGNFKGRLYNIKNNTAFTVTINSSAPETIGGSNSISLTRNQSIQIINTGLTGAAATWEVINNTITASNGLNIAANDVKLGGTLSQATNIANAGNNLTITGAGNVGFGLTNPRVKLEVYGIIGVQTGPFPNTINMAAFGWDAIQQGVGFNEYVNYRGTGNGGHRFYSLPDTGTPTLANSLSYLDINGSWHATAYAVSSDSRLKRNIKPVENGLDIISRLQPVSYEKRLNLSSQDYNTKEIGFLAQDLRKVLPDVVKEDTTDPDKLLSVNYDSLIPVLTKAIQELNAKVQKLEAENAELKKKTDKL